MIPIFSNARSSRSTEGLPRDPSLFSISIPRTKHYRPIAFSCENMHLFSFILVSALLLLPFAVATGTRGLVHSSPEDSEMTMKRLRWNRSRKARIEFCYDSEADVYGYRLPGDTSCGPAGIVIRMHPGREYTLIIDNQSNQVTNVHTHGLHISGEGSADNTLREVDPGMCLEYHYSIPVDHMGGTHWFHAHHRPLSANQVGKGAYAMLIIEDNKTKLLENIRRFRDRLKVLLFLRNERLLIIDTTNGLGNGRSDTSIRMVANEWYFLRVLTFSTSGGRKEVSFPNECQVHALAWDGIWKFTVPGDQEQGPVSSTGAGRFDVAIRCSSPGDLPITVGDGTFATLKVKNGRGFSYFPHASPFVGRNSDESWKTGRPQYLRDLVPIEESSFNKQDIMLQRGNLINGETFNEEEPLFEIGYNSLQEWTISGSAFHPMHTHVHHMQTYGCDGHEDGEYYDTVIHNNPSSSCKVRFHAIDYGGRMIFHCHNIFHADAGMSAWVEVSNNGPVQDTEDEGQMICPA